MCVREILCYVIGCISERKCHGKNVDVRICENLDGLNSNYVLELRVRHSNNFMFVERYVIEYRELCCLDNIRTKVNDILDDFCNLYERAQLDNFYKSLTDTK